MARLIAGILADAFWIFSEATRPFLVDRLRSTYANEWWEKGVEPHLAPEQRRIADRISAASRPTALVQQIDQEHSIDFNHFPQVVEGNWNEVFQKEFEAQAYHEKAKVIGWLSELREVRNLVAHNRPIDRDVALRALFNCRLLLRIYAPQEESPMVQLYADAERQSVEDQSVVQVRNLEPQTGSVQPAEAPKPVAPTILPQSKTESFRGRKDELEILHTLLLSGEPTNTVVLTGMPGIGKTELVRRFAESVSRHFTEGILWCDGSKHESGDIIRYLARRAGARPEDFEYRDPIDIWNSFVSGRDSLVLVTNAESLSREDFEPRQNRCKTILTTFDRRIPQMLSLPEVPLYPLDPDDAIELLQDLLSPHFDEADCEHLAVIADCLDGFPLALQMAASHLNRWQDQLAVSEYAQQLAAPPDRLGILDSGRKGISALFAVQLEQVTDEDKRLFAALSVTSSAGFTVSFAEALGEGIIGNARLSLGRLADVSLLRSGPDHQYRFFHGLVQDYGAKLATDIGITVQARLNACAWLMRLTGQTDRVAERRVPRVETDNAMAAADLWLDNGDLNWDHWRDAWRGIRENLKRTRRLDAAVQLLEKALDRSRQSGASEGDEVGAAAADKEMEAYFTAQLGNAYSLASRHEEAYEQLEHALELEQAREQDCLQEIESARQQGQAREESELGLKLASIQKRLNHVGLNIDNALMRSGYSKQAIERLRVRIEEVGESSDAVYYLNSLGRGLVLQKQPADAVEFFKRALEIEERHPIAPESKLITVSEMGNALNQLGLYPEAAACFNEILDLVDAEEDPRMASVSHMRLGEALSAQGLFSEAILHFADALAIVRRLSSSRTLRITRGRLGRVLDSVSQHSKVLQQQARVSRDWSEALLVTKAWREGEGLLGHSRSEFWALIDYGNILLRISDHSSACKVFQDARENAEIRNDWKARSIASQRLARALAVSGQTHEAIDVLMLAEQLETTHGSGKDVSPVLLEKARLLANSGDVHKALLELTKAEHAEIRGERTANTCRVLNDKVELLLDMGRRDLAAHAVESAWARLSPDERAEPPDLFLEAVRRKVVNTQRAEVMVVGILGIITDVKTRYGFIRLIDTAESRTVFFHESAVELWQTDGLAGIQSNAEAIVDYYEQSDGRLAANRVVLL